MVLSIGDQIFHVSPSPCEVHPIETVHPLSGNHQFWFFCQRLLSFFLGTFKFCQIDAPSYAAVLSAGTSFSELDEFLSPLPIIFSSLADLRS